MPLHGYGDSVEKHPSFSIVRISGEFLLSTKAPVASWEDNIWHTNNHT